MKDLWGRLRGHFAEYVNRYAVLFTAVLTPAAALLGALAADLGGIDTPVGRAILAVASALGAAAAAVTWLRNSGIWQMLDQFGTAPGGAQVDSLHPTLGKRIATAGASFSVPPGDVPPDLDDSVHELTDGLPSEPVDPDTEVGQL